MIELTTATTDQKNAITTALDANLLSFRTDPSQLFPDPFFSDTTLANGYRNLADSPIYFAGAWASLATITGSKYPSGKCLVRPNANVTAPFIHVSLDKMGIVEGDSVHVSFEARTTTGTATSGNMLIGQFFNRAGVAVGSTFNAIVPTVAAPLTTTLSTFTTGSQSVPADASRLRLHASAWGLVEWRMESLRVSKTSLPTQPTQNLIPEDLNNRLLAVEAANMQSRRNNLLLRRTSFTNSQVTLALGGIPADAAFAGYGQNLLASACPVAGFNAIQDTWRWVPGVNSPVQIIVLVTTAPTGKNALNQGKLLAIGSIGVDPLLGSGDSAPVQLFEPNGVTPKTILPADLQDFLGIAFVGIKADGTNASNIHVSRQNTNTSLADPANIGYFIAQANPVTGVGSGWGTIGTTFIWGPRLVNLTNPVTFPDVASVKLANSIGTKIAEPPLLQAVPQRLWCTVGKSTWLHYATVQMRHHLTTGFYGTPSALIPANSGNFEDGWRHTPAGAGNFTVTLRGEANGVNSATKACLFSAVTAATGSGTSRFLMMGDSMTASGAMQSRLNALAVGDVTSIVNMGTIGADPVKNEGYSGQANGIFFTAGNPFFNPTPGTFDFNYYMTNLAVADPTHVLIASGFWNAASATSDGDAQGSAASWVNQLELMIASIHAHNPLINVGVWTQPVHPYDAQDGDSSQITAISMERRRRNMIIFGEASIAAFSAREANKVYSVACGQTMNPQTTYPRSDWVPADAAVAARVVAAPYANYAALAADLAPGDGTIVAVTNGGTQRFYVKVWGTTLGHWRTVNESDGFVRRCTDSVHPSFGFNSAGDLVWSWIKATL